MQEVGGGMGKVGWYVLCGAGVVSPHIIVIVLSYILEEVQSVSGNTLCVIEQLTGATTPPAR